MKIDPSRVQYHNNVGMYGIPGGGVGGGWGGRRVGWKGGGLWDRRRWLEVEVEETKGGENAFDVGALHVECRL